LNWKSAKQPTSSIILIYERVYGSSSLMAPSALRRAILHRDIRHFLALPPGFLLPQKRQSTGRITSTGKGWQTPPQQFAVGFLDNTGVTHHQHAPVALGTDQAPCSLFQGNRGFWQLVFHKGITTSILALLDTRFQHGIIRWRKGQFV